MTNDKKIMKLSRAWKPSVLYIVKYRHSIVFGNIDICGHFSVDHEGKATKRPQKVTQVVICRRSEHYAVFIGSQRQLVHTSASDKGQERR